MKKKVLTTAAALAMLAPTMTSFASTQDKEVTGLDTTTPTSELQISGQVKNSSGQAPAGQLSVTLPTAVNFVVDQKGNFMAPTTMTITNNSVDANISVSVSSFTDPTKGEGEGITVVDAGDLTNKDRSFVSLSLTGSSSNGGSTVELLSAGISEQPLVDIDAQSQAGLALSGQAGNEPYSNGSSGSKTDIDASGASDQFTLVFKIAKKN